jgi:predicted deacylase
VLADAIDTRAIGRYHGLAEVEGAIAALGDVSEAGRSVEGRTIPRLTIGPIDAPRVSLVLAGLHALEWIGVETALAIARAWMPTNGRKLVVLPVINADGYARAEADLRAGRRRYLRANARGVDLNRNFPTHFRAQPLRARLLPLLGGPGPAPGSEPETQAVLDTLARDRGRIDRAVSLHSFGRKLLLPYGGRWSLPPDIASLRALAAPVKASLDRYGVTPAGRWGPGMFAHGMELDHLHAEGIAPLLVECSGGGLSLRDPSSWFHPFRWYNPPDPEVQSEAIARALVPFLAPRAR